MKYLSLLLFPLGLTSFFPRGFLFSLSFFQSPLSLRLGRASEHCPALAPRILKKSLRKCFCIPSQLPSKYFLRSLTQNTASVHSGRIKYTVPRFFLVSESNNFEILFFELFPISIVATQVLLLDFTENEENFDFSGKNFLKI